MPIIRTLSIATLATTCLAILGCGSNPGLQRVMENAKGIQKVEPCCKDMREVLAGAKPLAVTRLSFGPTTGHFDFGDGLAPFAAFAVGENAKMIEIEAPLQLVGWAYGGDGAARYVEAHPIYLDDQMVQIQTPAAIGRTQRFTPPAGARSLFQYFKVPPSVAYIVLTTDPRRNNESELDPILNAPNERLTSQSTKFSSYGNILPSGFKLANYGPVKIEVLPNN